MSARVLCERCGAPAVHQVEPGNMEAGYCGAHRPCACGAVLLERFEVYQGDGSEAFGFGDYRLHLRDVCQRDALPPGYRIVPDAGGCEAFGPDGRIGRYVAGTGDHARPAADACFAHFGRLVAAHGSEPDMGDAIDHAPGPDGCACGTPIPGPCHGASR